MFDIPPPLSPFYVNSFAYYTFKDRLPVIIARTVDSLYRNKKLITDKMGSDKVDDLKFITAEMSRLRHELTTDKTLTAFDNCGFGDENMWNEAILEEKRRLIESGISNDEVSWFKCSFLFGECYMYRRIYEAILKSGLRDLDQFGFEKEELLQKAVVIQQYLTDFLVEICSNLESDNIKTENKLQLFSYFETILKMCLWSNEVDLSLSIEDDRSKVKALSPDRIVADNNGKLLIDNVQDVFELLFTKMKGQQEIVVSIFLDNCGCELLADLHLVEFLLSSRLATKVVLYVKSMPWYVSDVTKRDFEQTIDYLCQSSSHPLNQWLGQRIASRLAQNDLDRVSCIGSSDGNGALTVRCHPFLTSPHPFCHMSRIYPDFYSELCNSALLIFKGDLNYRKLVGDLQWSPQNTNFVDSLRGFTPAPLTALRVLKCDVQVGLTAEIVSRAEKERPNNDWMLSSTFGVIQACLVSRS